MSRFMLRRVAAGAKEPLIMLDNPRETLRHEKAPRSGGPCRNSLISLLLRITVTRAHLTFVVLPAWPLDFQTMVRRRPGRLINAGPSAPEVRKL